MKVHQIRPSEAIQDKLIKCFAEFNQASKPSKGRRYPDHFKKLVAEAITHGISPSTVRRLTGMSGSAIRRCHVDKIKLKAPRRLEVVKHGSFQRIIRQKKAAP